MIQRYLCSILLMLCAVTTAFAQVDQMMETIGGDGGGHFTARCASDEILNGFELRAADDVDWIRAICTRPESPTSIGPRNLHATSAGGPGGRAMQLVCPDVAPLIAGMEVGSDGYDTRVVNNIRLYCGAAAINQRPAEYPTVAFDGIEAPREYALDRKLIVRMQICPAGLVPVGINGRAGKWLDALGFVCGALTLTPPPPPKPAAPAKPTLKAGAFWILVRWDRPATANPIEWYSIDELKDQRWVTLPKRIYPTVFEDFVEYPDGTAATQNHTFRVCAENVAHRSCSPFARYYSFAKGQAELSNEPNRASVSPPRANAVLPNGGVTQAAAQPAAAGRPAAATQSAAKLPDLDTLAARGAELAVQDPLAAELRNRTTDGALRRGFDIGFGIWEGNSAPGPGKQRVRDALSVAEQPGFDTAAAYALPRNKFAALANVGAAIGNADPALAAARNTENDVFYWLGFDIASGIFGDPAAGSLGNTAIGPGSLGIRNELNAPGQRGFNAATALHLGRRYQ
jgi:hypothetical protein